jgi:hypothetical protein
MSIANFLELRDDLLKDVSSFARIRAIHVGRCTARWAMNKSECLSEALAFGLRSEHRITTGMASRDPRRNFKHPSSMESDMTRSNFGTRKAAAWPQRAFSETYGRLQQRGAGLRVPAPRFTCHLQSWIGAGRDAGPKPGALVAGDDWPGYAFAESASKSGAVLIGTLSKTEQRRRGRHDWLCTGCPARGIR